jgi:hypothetical protein
MSCGCGDGVPERAAESDSAPESEFANVRRESLRGAMFCVAVGGNGATSSRIVWATDVKRLLRALKLNDILRREKFLTSQKRARFASFQRVFFIADNFATYGCQTVYSSRIQSAYL